VFHAKASVSALPAAPRQALSGSPAKNDSPFGKELMYGIFLQEACVY
jgi:hypothetical protein